MVKKQVSKQPFSKEQQSHIQAHVQKHVEKHVEKRLNEQLLTKAEFLGAQFKQHVSTAIIAAFSFLIALSWKDFIVNGTTKLIKEDTTLHSLLLIEFVSALVVTLVAIIGIFFVTVWAKKPHVISSETQTS